MHTKGKWEVTHSRPNGLRKCLFTQDKGWQPADAGEDIPMIICWHDDWQGKVPPNNCICAFPQWDEQSQANARLIAASPDLLAACEMIKKRLLTHGEWNEGCFYYANRSASELDEPLELLAAAIAKAKGGEL